MGKNFAEFIEHCLQSVEPLAPIPTDCPARLCSLPGIKAVLFDVYGTLLVSSSGDIDVTDYVQENALRALRTSGFKITEAQERDVACSVIAEFLLAIRRQHVRGRAAGRPHPEVDILGIWREVINLLEERGTVDVPADVDFEQLAFAFEMCSNAVYPMPGFRETVRMLEQQGILLGIVSNAQFFTPLIVKYFLSGCAGDDEAVAPFQKELTFFSYRYGRAKPDPFLFKAVADVLAEKEIPPQNVLFVGNDMLNDVWGAQSVGFRTALFAGDRRSLRLRATDPQAGSAKPDCVLHDLQQLGAVIREDN